MHVVVQRAVQAFAQCCMVYTRGVDKADVVFRKSALGQGLQLNAIFFRVLPTGECTVQAKR